MFDPGDPTIPNCCQEHEGNINHVLIARTGQLGPFRRPNPVLLGRSGARTRSTGGVPAPEPGQLAI